MCRAKTDWDVRFVDSFKEFWNCSIPCAPSRFNHYVYKVGGYHIYFDLYPKFPQCSPLNRNVSIFIHPCRLSEPNHSLPSDSLPLIMSYGLFWSTCRSKFFRISSLQTRQPSSENRRIAIYEKQIRFVHRAYMVQLHKPSDWQSITTNSRVKAVSMSSHCVRGRPCERVGMRSNTGSIVSESLKCPTRLTQAFWSVLVTWQAIAIEISIQNLLTIE